MIIKRVKKDLTHYLKEDEEYRMITKILNVCVDFIEKCPGYREHYVYDSRFGQSQMGRTTNLEKVIIRRSMSGTNPKKKRPVITIQISWYKYTGKRIKYLLYE